MGQELFDEVLNNAPTTLTTSERFLLAILAMRAEDDDPHRACWVGMEDLAHLMGYEHPDKPRRVYQLLNQLTAQGFEVRALVGTTGHGRPVYAHRERLTLFRLPRFK